MNEERRWIYTLSEGEMRRVGELADRRIKAHRKHDDSIGSKESAPARQRWGMAAELAVCWFLNIKTDPVWAFYSGRGDGGYKDLIDNSGQRLEVKCSGTGFLIVPPKNLRKLPGSDVLVACRQLPKHVSGPSVELLGWCPSSEYLERSVQHDFGRGVGLQPVVPWARLPGDIADLVKLREADPYSQLGQRCSFCKHPPPGLVHREPEGWGCLTCYVERAQDDPWATNEKPPTGKSRPRVRRVPR